MVAVISRLYGLEHIETAEDIVSESFLQAAETWGIKGMPPNPAAWLYAVAKQKTLYHFRRNKIFEKKVIPGLKEISDDTVDEELDFSLQNIKDSQLQMIFAVCNPAIASEAQIGLALRILCGFGIDEIAEAFLTSKDTINKRLYRAKEKLRVEKIKMEMPPESQLEYRVENVLRVVYLLFNEGYYSRTQNKILQKDLCLEAMRLCILLVEAMGTNLPKTSALLALMCFHASRFEARQSEEENIILYDEQDEKLWDMGLINMGIHYLELSASGDQISAYHLEARIAYWHCIKEDSKEKWAEILQLYNLLLEISYSPGAALNRIYALYKLNGAEAALAEMEKLNIDKNRYYFLLLGELYRKIDTGKAAGYLKEALMLSITGSEKEIIEKKINEL